MSYHTEIHEALRRVRNQILTKVDPENAPSQVDHATVVEACREALTSLAEGDSWVVEDYFNLFRLVMNDDCSPLTQQLYVKTLIAAMLMDVWTEMADGVPFEIHYKVAV